MRKYFPDKFIAATTEFTTKEKHVPAPYFRKRFHFTKGKTAEIRICGLGFYELYINGVNVTKGRLAPYITNPDEALYYDDYDVTSYLTDGENVIGVWLGNGMQNNPYGDIWDFDKAAFRSAPKFAMAFYEDGEIAFESDTSFVTKPSPIVFDDLRAGEHYDARLEIDGWNTLNVDDSDWQNAISAITPTGEKKLVESEPILVHREIAPVSVKKTPSGKYLYDFGINFTGVCRLKIKGERGQEIRLTHGEIVLDGELDLRNVINVDIGPREGYDHCDWYTLKGEGVETYTPRFTYHGFQYVEVQGLTDEQATLDLLTFEVMHSAVKKRGEFLCSDEIANVIQESTQRSDLSNLFYVPTDCPHREKNGWTGDIALSAEQMLVNFAVEKTLEDWLFSVRNAQDDRGAIPGIVPTGGWGFAWGAGPNWDDVLFEIPYQTYRYTGDVKIIQDNLVAMKTYLRYMETKKNEEGLFEYGLGDWAQPKSHFQFTTPTEITDSIKCADMCDKAAKMAKLVGDEEMAAYAQGLAEEIRKAIKKKYIQDGKLTITEQTALAYALYYDISKEDEETLRGQLLERIAQDDEVFTTGVLGARVLFRVLSDMGQGDLAYKLITQNRYPSYGYNVIRGTRTLAEQFYPLSARGWEREDGQKHDSLNHHFWGDVSAWFILRVAGIQINPDFYRPDSVVIAPDFLDGLTFAQGKIAHRKGDVFSRWERVDGGAIKLIVIIPQGVEGILRLPIGYVCENQALCEGEQEIIVSKREK